MMSAATVAAAAIVATQSVRAEWVEATSKHFIVYASGGPAAVKRQAEQLERFDSLVRYFHALPDRPEDASNKLTVYVVADDDAVRRLYGGKSRYVSGFYEGRVSGSIAFTPGRGSGDGPNDISSQIVLFHEYAHHLMLGNFSSAYPSWFSEGYAEFLSTVRFQKDFVWVGAPADHRGYDLLLGKPFTVEKLVTADLSKIREEDQSAFYGWSWLLTHYIYANADRQPGIEFNAYLNALNQGKPPLEAARHAFGDLAALDKAIRARLRGSSIPAFKISLDKLPQPTVTLRPLSAGERAMIELRMRSDRGVDTKSAQPILADAIPIAARYPSDAVVQGWFAEMALDADRLDLAEQAADRALAADPKSSQALVYKGLVHLTRAQKDHAKDPAVWKEARSWLIKANALDANDAYALMLFYLSFGMGGNEPTTNAKLALQRAHELVPQDEGLGFTYARQAIVDGKIDEARRALRPLAYSAHASPDNAAARLLAALDRTPDGKAALTVVMQGANAAGDSGGPAAH